MSTSDWFSPLRPSWELTPTGELSGANGVHRAPRTQLTIAADTDWDAVEAFLQAGTDHNAMTALYRTSLSRLFLWSWFVQQKPVSSLTYVDFQDFVSFCKHPNPQQFWHYDVPATTTKRTGWNPFDRSRVLAKYRSPLAIKKLFEFWVRTGYITGNPIGDSFTRGFSYTKEEGAIKRRVAAMFDEEDWAAFRRALDALPTHTPQAMRSAERARFWFNLVFYLAPTLVQIQAAKMNHFSLEGGVWLWRTEDIRTGDVSKIPVPENMLAAFSRYRAFCGLSPLPGARDDSPLILNHGEMESIDHSRLPARSYQTTLRIFTYLKRFAAEQILDNSKSRAQAIRSMSYTSFLELAVRQRCFATNANT